MPHKDKHSTGSPQVSEPIYLLLGKLRRAHGIKGEIPLEIYSDMLELLSPEQVVYVGEIHQAHIIQETRWKNELLLIKFIDLNSREMVSQLTNANVYVKADQLPALPDDEYYPYQLIGLDVYDDQGSYLGQLIQILRTGANDVYLIENQAGDETLIPAIEDVILEVDLKQKKMLVVKLEWYGGGT